MNKVFYIIKWALIFGFLFDFSLMTYLGLHWLFTFILWSNLDKLHLFLNEFGFNNGSIASVLASWHLVWGVIVFKFFLPLLIVLVWVYLMTDRFNLIKKFKQERSELE